MESASARDGSLKCPYSRHFGTPSPGTWHSNLAKSFLLLLALSPVFCLPACAEMPSPSAPPGIKAQGLSTFGTRKYADGFKHLDYVNPHAPKGGQLHLSALGTFNSFNPFIVKGDYPAGIGLIFAKLMEETTDRAGETYSYVAESVEVAPDRSSIIFNLNPKAQFDDGVKITADTVIWSFNTLKDKGSPMFRTYYKNVTKVEKLSEHQIKFHLDGTKNAELPVILGQTFILPKHFYEKVDFSSTSLHIPPSSGPYRIKSFDAGRTIIYERVKNWWASQIPSQIGKNNFDEICFEFFLDVTSQFEAFKSQRIDLRVEGSIKTWNTEYNFPAVKQGWIIREELAHEHTEPTYGFFFNLRRPLFQDAKIREALTIMYNFEGLNKRLFYNAYRRNLSYFPNSCFAARDLPSTQELEVLLPLKQQIPERVFSQPFTLPSKQDAHDLRATMSKAIKLFEEAGWHIKGGRMVNKQTNAPFTFELLIDDKSKEKLCMPYVDVIERIGIKASVRSIDKAAYTQKVDNKDFDIILDSILQSNSLGNEQRDFFGSARADSPGTFNYAGIKDPIIDKVIEQMIQSESYPQLCQRARALDRLLLWGFYMIPAWHKGAIFVAYWDKFGHPQTSSKFSPFNIQTWWYDEQKAQSLKNRMTKSSTSSFFATVLGHIKRIFS
ncbi:extracellular solute-binding protein [Candidatus Odyssella thessalonicensis]|uniref:extracellular solute-binding protein n=1 Tax=Candidatus Odyssella thessalonicensis TaxID=84647 RepID=UPI000225AF06|nr:extracellular solute-binding protein [Candidatus Odyssella thessalonicensis]